MIRIIKWHLIAYEKERCGMPIIESTIFAMMTSVLLGAAALLLAAVGEWDEAQRLICICTAGGIAGGILSVAIFPRSTVRQNAIKWLISPITAGAFAPSLCIYYGIDDSIVHSIAISGLIGLFAWGVLFVVVPIGPIVAKKFASKYVPGVFEEEYDENIKPSRPDWVSRESKRLRTKDNDE